MSQHESSEEIRRDIERTRSELGNTVDAIQERLHPDNLRQQAQAAIQQAITDTADSISDYVGTHREQLTTSLASTIKRNPLATVLVGTGVGWLMIDMLSSSGSGSKAQERSYYGGQAASSRYDRERYEQDRYDEWARMSGYDTSDASAYDTYQRRRRREMGYQYGYGERAQEHEKEGLLHQAKDTAQDAVGTVAGTVRDAAMQVGGAVQSAAAAAGGAVQDVASGIGSKAQHQGERMAGQVGERVGDMGESMQHQAAYMGGQAQRYAARTQRRAQRTINDNPLVFGALALGVGTLMALLLPETRRENEWLGETRDRVFDTAGSAVQDMAQRARTVAEEVAPEVKQAAQRAMEDVKQAGEESLSHQKEQAMHASDQTGSSQRGAGQMSSGQSSSTQRSTSQSGSTQSGYGQTTSSQSGSGKMSSDASSGERGKDKDATQVSISGQDLKVRVDKGEESGSKSTGG